MEAFKFAYAQRLKLGDPAFNDTIDDVRDIKIPKGGPKNVGGVWMQSHQCVGVVIYLVN